MNQSDFIFSECDDCGKELNDLEKEFCQKMHKKTNQIIALCSLCLDKNDGQWPAIVPIG